MNSEHVQYQLSSAECPKPSASELKSKHPLSASLSSFSEILELVCLRKNGKSGKHSGVLVRSMKPCWRIIVLIWVYCSQDLVGQTYSSSTKKRKRVGLIDQQWMIRTNSGQWSKQIFISLFPPPRRTIPWRASSSVVFWSQTSFLYFGVCQAKISRLGALMKMSKKKSNLDSHQLDWLNVCTPFFSHSRNSFKSTGKINAPLRTRAFITPSICLMSIQTQIKMFHATWSLPAARSVDFLFHGVRPSVTKYVISFRFWNLRQAVWTPLQQILGPLSRQLTSPLANWNSLLDICHNLIANSPSTGNACWWSMPST